MTADADFRRSNAQDLRVKNGPSCVDQARVQNILVNIRESAQHSPTIQDQNKIRIT